MADSPKQSIITKEDASDLKSFTDRLIQTELELQRATFAREQAQRDLANYLHRLQYPKNA